MLSFALVTALTGCVDYVDRPAHGSVYVEPAFAIQDDYVYYPNYECYYSISRHQYAYREGNAWVSRPAPRGVSVNVLLASPSVKMNFHDSPAQHHATVAKQYPKTGSRPVEIRAKTARTTNMTKITKNKRPNRNHTLKGTLC